MTTITVHLPGAVMSAVAERAQKNRFADVNEFVSQMIAKISERQTQAESVAIDDIARHSQQIVGIARVIRGGQEIDRAALNASQFPLRVSKAFALPDGR